MKEFILPLLLMTLANHQAAGADSSSITYVDPLDRDPDALCSLERENEDNYEARVEKCSSIAACFK